MLLKGKIYIPQEPVEAVVGKSFDLEYLDPEVPYLVEGIAPLSP